MPARKIDSSVPHSARVWNYWLGGRDHYDVDRVVGSRVEAEFPEIRDLARLTRSFLGRVVRFLVSEAGVRQFLDVGTGLPTADNTHEVAQAVAPECRIVYVDNDPLVLAYARALLTSSSQGSTNYIDADLRDPERILRQASKSLDLAEPVALLLIGILGHVGDYDAARSIVGRFLDALPSGSYLAVNDSINTSEPLERAMRRYEESGAVPYRTWTLEEFTGFFDGLDLVQPGVVPIPQWRPRDPPGSCAVPAANLPGFGGVACKRLGAWCRYSPQGALLAGNWIYRIQLD